MDNRALFIVVWCCIVIPAMGLWCILSLLFSGNDDGDDDGDGK